MAKDDWGGGGGGHNPEYVDRGERKACVVVLGGWRRKTCVGR